jgi:hypothetical protein
MGVTMVFAAWVLVGTMSMMDCRSGTCTPMAGASRVTQEVRRFPTLDTCEHTRQQMVKTVGAHTTTVDVIDPSTRSAGVVRQAIVWSCQRATGEQGD